MNLEIAVLSEVSLTQTDDYHMITLICRVLKKYGKRELIYKTEVESKMQKTNLQLPGDKRGEGYIERLGLTYTHYYKVSN